jgi:erythromycin esterase-like protein
MATAAACPGRRPHVALAGPLPVQARTRSVGNAEIVGLGESVHGAAEELALKHRTLRFLPRPSAFPSCAATCGSSDPTPRTCSGTSGWQRYSRDKVVSWAASTHTAYAPGLRIAAPAGTAPAPAGQS